MASNTVYESYIKQLKQELQKKVDFINQYHNLGRCHMVEYITASHWDKMISHRAKSEVFNKIGVDNIAFLSNKYQDEGNHVVEDFVDFYEVASKNSTRNLHVIPLEELQLLLNNDSKIGSSSVVSKFVHTKEFMCTKKAHEVEKMSELIYKLSGYCNTDVTLDIGSGKGYLGSYLSLRYGIRVIGVDSSDSNSINALLRARKFNKYWKLLLKNKTNQSQINKDLCNDMSEKLSFKPVTAYIQNNVDVNTFLFNDIEEKVKIEENSGCNPKILMSGLHACGDLSTSILRTFVSNKDCKALCVVGCCYHLISEDVSDAPSGFPLSEYVKSLNIVLGRNSKLLALRALEKVEASDPQEQFKSEESLFFRAVLTILLEKEFGICSTSTDVRVGRVYKKSKNFVDYVRRSLRILKIPEQQQKQLSDEEIQKYVEENMNHRWTLSCFNYMRNLFGTVVESVILLDRLLYLHENNIKNCHLVRLFDPVISPRCYAFVAWR